MVAQFEGQRVDQSALDAIEHWRPPTEQLLAQILIDAQRRNDLVTGILELGVHKGWFLSILAGAVAGIGVPVVGVDAFLADFGRKLDPEDQAYAECAIHDAIAAVTGRPSGATIVDAYTCDVSIESLLELAPDGYSFVSVDTSSTAPDQDANLAIVDRTLSNGGLAWINAVFDSSLPGAGQGFFEYCFGHPKADLAPFATISSAVLVCRRARYEFYSDACLTSVKRIESMLPASMTTVRMEQEANAFTPLLFDYAIIPLG